MLSPGWKEKKGKEKKSSIMNHECYFEQFSDIVYNSHKMDSIFIIHNQRKNLLFIMYLSFSISKFIYF